MARTKGSFGLTGVAVQRSFIRELQLHGIAPGARLAQMSLERKAAGDWKGELVVYEAVRRWTVPVASHQVSAPGQMTLTWADDGGGKGLVDMSEGDVVSDQ